MNTAWRSLMELRRRPVKYIIFFLIFTVSFVFLLLGLTLHETSSGAKAQVMDMIGPYFQLSQREENEAGFVIDDSIRQSVSDLPHVKGINQSKAEYALAGNFETVKAYQGVTPDSDPSLYEDFEGLTPESVILDMNWDVSLIDDFRLGDSALLEGSYPDSEHPGLLIEQSLAEQNGLEIGDQILLQSAEGRQTWGAVVGIYQTQGTFEITEGNSVGEAVFAWSPYNRIYASLDFCESLYDTDISLMSLSIYVDGLGNMEEVGDGIKAMDLDWDVYVLYDMTATNYELNQQAAQIETLGNYSNLILIYTVLIVIVLLMLVLNLFLQYYMGDAGILIALGCSKEEVGMQYLCSVMTVALAAIVVATTVSAGLLEPVIGKLIESTTVSWEVYSSYENGLNHTVALELRHLDTLGWGAFLLGVILLVLISAFPLLWRLFRYHPRTILARENE